MPTVAVLMPGKGPEPSSIHQSEKKRFTKIMHGGSSAKRFYSGIAADFLE